MLQALFYCQPFREKVLSYHPSSREEGGVSGSGLAETLLSVLAELFQQIAQSKKKVGVLYPKKFIAKVKKENGRLRKFTFVTVELNNMISYLSALFDNMQQQDAHEFLNYLLNTIADLLQGKKHYTSYIYFLMQLYR